MIYTIIAFIIGVNVGVAFMALFVGGKSDDR